MTDRAAGPATERGAAMRYAVITFGCRVNQADALAIERDLRQRGGVAAPPEEADVLVVNTCSVTASADQGARQLIRRVARANPDVRIVTTGCYATRAPRELAALPNVTAVVPNERKESVAELATGVATTSDRYAGGDGPCGAICGPGVGGRTAFTLRVQTGCDERCSYCIIPSTRGASRSRTPDAVIADLDRAIEAGYREVALTGVHLGSYGRDLPDSLSLTGLVRRIAQRYSRDILFRLSSLEPMDCTPELVSLVASSPLLAPHFHLPLQHGSDPVLRAMRRPYTAAFYTELVGLISASMPHASIGSDVIAGFPGETEAQFEHSAAVISRLPLSHLHVFPYSDRPGTEASRLHPKVDGAVIRERARRLREIGAELARRFRSAQAGTRRRALVVDGGLSAVTDNYLKVTLNVREQRNTWVVVTVTEGAT